MEISTWWPQHSQTEQDEKEHVEQLKIKTWQLQHSHTEHVEQLEKRWQLQYSQTEHVEQLKKKMTITAQPDWTGPERMRRTAEKKVDNYRIAQRVLLII